jgi:hypothetical protein
VTADRGSAGGAGGLALVPDCPPSDTHTPQVTHPVTAATAAAGSYNTGTPLTWGLRPLSANLLSGPPQQALLLQPLPQGRISSSSSGGAAEGSPGAAAGGAGSGVMFSTGGFHIAAAAAGGVGTQGRPLLLRQVSGPSPPPASAAGTATVVKAGGQLYLLHQQLQAAPAPVKIGTGGQTTGPTASRSSSFEMAVVPDHGQRQGPSCSGQSDSSSPQGGVGGSSHGSGAGWRGHSSSDGADNSPTSATAAAAAAAAGSMAMGRPSCSPAPSSPVSPRGVTHAVTRRPGLVTRRLAAAAAAAALGGSGSAPGGGRFACWAVMNALHCLAAANRYSIRVQAIVMHQHLCVRPHLLASCGCAMALLQSSDSLLLAPPHSTACSIRGVTATPTDAPLCCAATLPAGLQGSPQVVLPP